MPPDDRYTDEDFQTFKGYVNRYLNRNDVTLDIEPPACSWCGDLMPFDETGRPISGYCRGCRDELRYA